MKEYKIREKFEKRLMKCDTVEEKKKRYLNIPIKKIDKEKKVIISFVVKNNINGYKIKRIKFIDIKKYWYLTFEIPLKNSRIFFILHN